MPKLSSASSPVVDADRKVAVVTGAAKRIGRAVSMSLASDGWDIALHVRSENDPAATEVADAIIKQGRRATIIPADLANSIETARIMDVCQARLGAATCLVNNASLFEEDQIGDLSDDLWTAHLDINLKSPVFLGQALLQQLPESKTGNVINIIDQRVLRLTPEFFSYTISKSALWTATRTMAIAMAPRVRVNAIGPGPVLQSIHQTEADFAEEVASVPLKRGASPEEIAAGVRMILQTPAMTGQMIALDGGQHLL
ncbi:MAG: SDR family oxidoreductase [Pseudomonadota bacterium]